MILILDRIKYVQREAAKKVILLLAGPLRPNPPPWALERWNVEKKRFQKKLFFSLMARPLREDFFCGFPKVIQNLEFTISDIQPVSQNGPFYY